MEEVVVMRGIASLSYYPLNKMTYELAKQLKDAGFPFRYAQSPFEVANIQFDDGSIAYYPTLSELIEAYGEDFDHLSQKIGYPEGGKWWAITHSKFDDNGNNYEACGSTPEEAVCRLWLELNKK